MMTELIARSLKFEELVDRLADHEDPAVRVFAKKADEWMARFKAEIEEKDESEAEDLKSELSQWESWYAEAPRS